MQYLVQGKGQVELTQTHFKGQGGEGQVYVLRNTAYKIYTDPSKAIPAQKIAELSKLSPLRNVICPMQMILNPQTQLPVGYTMRYVKDTHVLCELFTRTFREANGLGPTRMFELVRKFQSGVEAVHRANVLIVDLNEMNFLVPKSFDDVYFIDVDSYQTPSYKATAIMPSIRDWQATSFNQNTDWFSFAILSFYMMIGIHPFKAKHPDYRDNSFEEKVRNNISIFNPLSRIPKVCYPFKDIPSGYLDWYKALFVEGKRLPPPTDPLACLIVQSPSSQAPKITSNILDITKMWLFANTAREYFEYEGMSAVVFDGVIRIEGVEHSMGPANYLGVVWAGKSKCPVLATHKDSKLFLQSSGLEIFETDAEEMQIYENRIYVKTGGDIYEVTITEFGGKLYPSLHLVGNVHPMASKLYKGVAIQQLFKNVFVSLFPQTKTGYQIQISELSGRRITDAKLDGNVLMVIASQNGIYTRFVFIFDEDFSSYAVIQVVDITPSGLNFVNIENRMFVTITEDETLEIQSANKNSARGPSIIKDPTISGQMKLTRVGNKVGFLQDGGLYQMSMTKK